MFTTQQLQALRALVVARRDVAAPEAPDRPLWDGLLGTVDGELRVARSRRAGKAGTTEVGASGGGAGLTEADVGDKVFAIDLPLQIEVPRKKPRILWAAPGEKPQAVRGDLARKLFGSTKAAKAALKSWANLPVGATVSFKGGTVCADDTPITVVLCPTMNAYKSMQTFARQNARKVLAERIADERKRWPNAAWGGQHEKVKRGKSERLSPVGGERRLVRVTRFSARRPDELSVDVLGGKMPVDQLVLAGILGDDSDAWAAREGLWEPAKTGAGFLRVEVYRLKGEHGAPRPAAARKRSKKKASDAADPAPDDPT